MNMSWFKGITDSNQLTPPVFNGWWLMLQNWWNDHDNGTRAWTNLKVTTLTPTTVGPFTETGAIAMGGNKITGLANGTVATDAAAFGQIKVIQIVPKFSFADTATTSSTFQSTPLTLTITPTSTANSILIMVMGILVVSAAATNAIATIFNGSTNLAAGATLNAMIALRHNDGNAGEAPASMIWIDSPASVSAQTYTVKVASQDNVHTVQFGNGYQMLMVAIEVVF